MKIYSIWCEWDIGINRELYTNQALAIKDIKAALKNCGIEESYEELVEERLVGIEPREVKGKIHVLVPRGDRSFYQAMVDYETVVEDPGGDHWEYFEDDIVPEGGEVYEALTVR